MNYLIQFFLWCQTRRIGTLPLETLIEDCKQGHNSTWKVEALLTNLSTQYAVQMKEITSRKFISSVDSLYFARVPKAAEQPGSTKANPVDDSIFTQTRSLTLFSAPVLGFAYGLTALQVPYVAGSWSYH